MGPARRPAAGGGCAAGRSDESSVGSRAGHWHHHGHVVSGRSGQRAGRRAGRGLQRADPSRRGRDQPDHLRQQEQRSGGTATPRPRHDQRLDRPGLRIPQDRAAADRQNGGGRQPDDAAPVPGAAAGQHPSGALRAGREPVSDDARRRVGHRPQPAGHRGLSAGRRQLRGRGHLVGGAGVGAVQCGGDQRRRPAGAVPGHRHQRRDGAGRLRLAGDLCLLGRAGLRGRRRLPRHEGNAGCDRGSVDQRADLRADHQHHRPGAGRTAARPVRLRADLAAGRDVHHGCDRQERQPEL